MTSNSRQLTNVLRECDELVQQLEEKRKLLHQLLKVALDQNAVSKERLETTQQAIVQRKAECDKLLEEQADQDNVQEASSPAPSTRSVVRTPAVPKPTGSSGGSNGTPKSTQKSLPFAVKTEPSENQLTSSIRNRSSMSGTRSKMEAEDRKRVVVIED